MNVGPPTLVIDPAPEPKAHLYGRLKNYLAFKLFGWMHQKKSIILLDHNLL